MEGDWPKGESPRSGRVFFSNHKKQEIQQLTQEKARQHHALIYCLRVDLPNYQSGWNRSDSDFDENWSAGSPGPNFFPKRRISAIRSRTVSLRPPKVAKNGLF